MADTQTIPAVLRAPDFVAPDFVPFDLWAPKFPSVDLVDTAATLIPDAPCGHVQEGPQWHVSVSPGKVKVWTRDEADRERTLNRERDAQMLVTDAMAAFIEVDDDGNLISDVPERTPSREITGWSVKSRRNMVERLCDLDYAPMFGDPTRLLAMVTLTYPGCWLRVAPNGKTVKTHLKTFRKRYERAYGEPLACVWKLEFQGRQEYQWRKGELVRNWCSCAECDGRDDGRAPHVHMLMRPPHQLVDGMAFKEWLSRTWADVVAHPDPEQYRRHLAAGTGVDFSEGLRATDPRRIAVYFTKHGAFQAKEYQHCVPEAWREPGEGPGRFWGYWGLEPAIATRSVTPEVGSMAGRIVRRYSRAQQVTQQVRRPRAALGQPVSKYPEVIGLAGAQMMESRRTRFRPTRTRAVRCKNGRGWISLNSGPDFCIEMSIALRIQLEQRDVDANRRELERCGLWDTPLARALRLAPGPRRDALVARFAAK